MQEVEVSRPADASRRPFVVVVFTLFTLAVVAAVVRVLAPYLTSILLAAILVTFTFPMFRRLRARLKGRAGLAAVFMLIGMTVLLVIPSLGILALLVQQATDLFDLLQKTDFKSVLANMQLEQRLAFVHRFAPGFDPTRLNIEAAIVSVVKQAPRMVATHGGAFLGSFANVVIGFFLTLLAAYYFYVGGEQLVRELKMLSPLPDEHDRAISDRFRSVINATFRGQVLTALAQGCVTAVGLGIAGVPGSVFWGAVAAVFSLIPMVGAAAIWVPASIYLFLAASYGDRGYFGAIFLVIWGVLVVSLVDNVIRPWAMKGGTDMPAVVLLFSILGGIQAFGFVGLILGPLFVALLITVIEIYRQLFVRPTPIPTVSG